MKYASKYASERYTVLKERNKKALNKRNYQKELEKLIDQAQKEQKVPSLFLHSCCAPCSSYVLEYLSQYFNITVFYYNPNIYPEEEYQKRVHEITRLVNSMEFVHPVKLVEGHYDPQEFFQMAKRPGECTGRWRTLL